MARILSIARGGSHGADVHLLLVRDVVGRPQLEQVHVAPCCSCSVVTASARQDTVASWSTGTGSAWDGRRSAVRRYCPEAWSGAVDDLARSSW